MISAHLLLEARRRAGLSQAQLARRCNKAASAIGRWERGEVEPSLETLRELIEAAGLDLTFGVSPRDDHDRTLIRRSLMRSPAERLSTAVAASTAVNNMVEAARG